MDKENDSDNLIDIASLVISLIIILNGKYWWRYQEKDIRIWWQINDDLSRIQEKFPTGLSYSSNIEGNLYSLRFVWSNNWNEKKLLKKVIAFLFPLRLSMGVCGNRRCAFGRSIFSAREDFSKIKFNLYRSDLKK